MKEILESTVKNNHEMEKSDNIMTLEEAITVRHSRRKYLLTPINHTVIMKLQKFIDEYNQKANLNMKLVINNGKPFSNMLRSYGMFSGVSNYVGLITNQQDPTCNERLGYYGELLVLQAVTMGLGTCWVGGTFDRLACPFSLSKNEIIACTIVLGNIEKQDSMKEKLIRTITHRGTKNVEEMYVSDGPVPVWFLNGMKAVQKAPSAYNRQPVTFTYKDGKVTASVKDITDTDLVIALGIAKLHFELGSGGGKWNWGNNAEFIR